MGFTKIKAIELLSFYENRSDEYGRFADRLLAASRVPGQEALAAMAKKIQRDCRVDTMLMAMIRINLMCRRKPLEFDLPGIPDAFGVEAPPSATLSKRAQNHA